MKLRAALGVLLVVFLAAVCVRLGFWQLSRLAGKRAQNAVLRGALANDPVEIGRAPPPLERLRGFRVRMIGHYDEGWHVLLRGWEREGVPGVRVITPLVLGGGDAVLVDRGWLSAEDGATARPQDCREPGTVTVVGLPDAIPAHVSGAPWQVLSERSPTLWSARSLSLDSLRGRLPYAIAPYLVRQLPAPDLPRQPVRDPPALANEAMHLGYAVQWFLFAVLLLVGPPIVLWVQRRAALGSRGAAGRARPGAGQGPTPVR
jgi:surfeit locus 1 family protein